MHGKEPGEQNFEEYLAEQQLEGGGDHHPDLGGERRPDYRVSSEGVSAICEVKEFRKTIADRRMAGTTGGVLSSRHCYGTPRNTVGKAAKNQLRPFADRGEPLIVVLTNPRGAYVPLEEPHDVIAMMYGNPGVSTSSDGSSPSQTIFMEDGVFGGNRHRYVSAVATLHRRELSADAKDDWLDCNEHQWTRFDGRQQMRTAMVEALWHPSFEEAALTLGAYFFIRVYSTIGTVTGDAVPVPRGLFSGPHDEFWAPNVETGNFELVTDDA